MELDGRTVSGGYRYGFQDQEKDDEVKGEGNSINYMFRMHDPRLGRFFAVDPMTKRFPHNSAFAFSENRVIDCGELEGLQIFYAADGTRIGQFGSSTQVRVVQNKDVEAFKKEFYNAKYSHNEFIRIKTNIENNAYSSGLSEAKNKMYKHAKVSINFQNNLIEKMSSEVKISQKELTMRATLTMIRQAESHGNNPEAYNRDEIGTVFTTSQSKDIEGTLSNDEYSAHPGSSPNDASGAFQIQLKTWNLYKYQLGEDNNFTPVNQDKMAIILIKEQVKWSPNKQDLLNNIYSGDIRKAIPQLRGTWTSLPGTNQSGITEQQALQFYKNAISNELRGKSVIATPQGSLKL